MSSPALAPSDNVMRSCASKNCSTKVPWERSHWYRVNPKVQSWAAALDHELHVDGKHVCTTCYKRMRRLAGVVLEKRAAVDELSPLSSGVVEGGRYVRGPPPETHAKVTNLYHLRKAARKAATPATPTNLPPPLSHNEAPHLRSSVSPQALLAHLFSSHLSSRQRGVVLLRTPAPASARTPTPVGTRTPVPASTRTPAPASTRTPAPASTRTPASASTRIPVPAPASARTPGAFAPQVAAPPPVRARHGAPSTPLLRFSDTIVRVPLARARRRPPPPPPHPPTQPPTRSVACSTPSRNGAPSVVTLKTEPSHSASEIDRTSLAVPESFEATKAEHGNTSVFPSAPLATSNSRKRPHSRSYVTSNSRMRPHGRSPVSPNSRDSSRSPSPVPPNSRKRPRSPSTTPPSARVISRSPSEAQPIALRTRKRLCSTRLVSPNTRDREHALSTSTSRSPSPVPPNSRKRPRSRGSAPAISTGSEASSTLTSRSTVRTRSDSEAVLTLHRPPLLIDSSSAPDDFVEPSSSASVGVSASSTDTTGVGATTGDSDCMNTSVSAYSPAVHARTSSIPPPNSSSSAPIYTNSSFSSTRANASSSSSSDNGSSKSRRIFVGNVVQSNSSSSSSSSSTAIESDSCFRNPSSELSAGKQHGRSLQPSEHMQDVSGSETGQPASDSGTSSAFSNCRETIDDLTASSKALAQDAKAHTPTSPDSALALKRCLDSITHLSAFMNDPLADKKWVDDARAQIRAYLTLLGITPR